MNNRRRILAQGHIDGACFLYSIANAVIALTGRSITRNQWERAILSLPFRVEDFLAGAGTTNFDGDPDLLLALCTSFLGGLNSTFRISLVNKIGSAASLNRVLTSGQVLVICADGHWEVVVETVGNKAFVACSSQALYGEIPYTEAKSPKFARTYNLVQPIQELKIWNGPNFFLSSKPSLKRTRSRV